MDMGSRASMLLVLLWCLLLRWVAWSGVVLSGDYRSCSDVSHLSPAQPSQVLIDPQDTFYNFILFLNIKWMFPPQATGQWRNMENGGLNMSKFNFQVLIHRFIVLICKILSLCYTQCKVNSSTTQNKVSEPLLIFVWFLSMCSVLFLLGSVLVLLGCLKLPTSFKQDSWYLIPCHNIKWMLCIVKIRIVCNIHFWIFPYIPVLLCNVLH